jgi:hypothetical protein
MGQTGFTLDTAAFCMLFSKKQTGKIMSTSVYDIPKFEHKPLLDSIANYRRTISHVRYAGLILLSLTSFILPMTPLFPGALGHSNLGQAILSVGLIGFIFSIVFWFFDGRLNILQSSELKALHKMADGNEQIAQALTRWISEGRTPLWKDFEIVRKFQEESKRRKILVDMAESENTIVLLNARKQQKRQQEKISRVKINEELRQKRRVENRSSGD